MQQVCFALLLFIPTTIFLPVLIGKLNLVDLAGSENNKVNSDGFFYALCTKGWIPSSSADNGQRSSTHGGVFRDQ